jgi:hypothetical protein
LAFHSNFIFPVTGTVLPDLFFGLLELAQQHGINVAVVFAGSMLSKGYLRFSGSLNSVLRQPVRHHEMKGGVQRPFGFVPHFFQANQQLSLRSGLRFVTGLFSVLRTRKTFPIGARDLPAPAPLAMYHDPKDSLCLNPLP